jgi:regulator of protease activity HflC (stomatin/prohibitin superfamily)
MRLLVSILGILVVLTSVYLDLWPLAVIAEAVTALAWVRVQLIRDGRVIHSIPPSKDLRMPGPGVLIIQSGNAAVLEQSGKIARIVGAGLYLTQPLEHLSAIVDLSLQSKTWVLADVLTKDMIPIGVELTVQYRIMIDQSALITKGEYGFDDDIIRRVVLTTHDWHEQTEIVAKSILRDTIATRFLDEIYDPRSLQFLSGATPRVPLQHEMRRRLSQQSQRWGVEIVRVSIDKITLPPEVRQRMIEAWDVNWHEVVEIARAATEARVIGTKALGEGEAEYIKAIKAARARVESAGIDGLVRLLSASPKSRIRALVRLLMEQKFESFKEADQQKLIQALAEILNIPTEEIDLQYVVSGSALVTFELPADASLKLMELYTNGSLGDLGIVRVEVRILPTPGTDEIQLLSRSSRLEPDVDYERGLHRVGKLLKERQSNLQSEFHTLEARLLGYLKDENWFGSSETTRADRARVIASINDLVHRAELGDSFIEFCRTVDPANRNNEIQRPPSKAGTESTIEPTGTGDSLLD